jgi:GNAT superfamily N-acetyltransferase
MLFRNGLTFTHLTFIQRGHAIILCLAVQPSQRIPLEIADVLFASHDHKPSIIIVLSSLSPGETYHHREPIPFPTVILTKGHSPAALEAAASLIYANPSPKPSPPPLPQLPHNPTTWPVTPFDDTLDTPEIHALWTETLPARFSLSPATLSSLLHRPGYAKHYTVRSPPSSSSSTSPILGFCATYLTYADREGEDLVACLAVLLVWRDARGRGIGRTLHDHALRELGRTRGVARFQLGSTFPRLLAGPLLGELGMGGDAEEWFGRRGWRMKSPKIPGQGGVVRDLVLDLKEWKTRGPGPGSGSGSGEVGFRAANQEDMNEVLELVDTTAKRLGRMGWFDQYAALMNGPNVKDVILSVEAERIVAVALTYTPSCGSQISSNLPWAGRTGDDVGGVTCICISGEHTVPLSEESLL